MLWHKKYDMQIKEAKEHQKHRNHTVALFFFLHVVYHVVKSVDDMIFRKTWGQLFKVSLA